MVSLSRMYRLTALIMVLSVSVVHSYLFADIPPGYYNGTDNLHNEQLKQALHNIIDDHIEFSYDDLRDFILKDTDEDPNNPNNILCLYTGWSLPKSSFGGGASDWNREHVWAKSHGDFGNSAPCGTDAHHIRPTDCSVNSRRGNLDFDDGGSHYTDGDGATGCYVDGDSWEPRDAVKGDVARMIFYMAVRYEGDSGEPDLEMVDHTDSSPSGQPYHGVFSTLLEWHQEDPVDAWEIERNDRIHSYQQNRNPFVDHPEFAARIWGGETTAPNDIPAISSLSVYPNPFNPETTISFTLENADQVALSIYNLRGQRIATLIDATLPPGNHSIPWQADTVSSGVYFLRIQDNSRSQVRKLLMIK